MQQATQHPRHLFAGLAGGHRRRRKRAQQLRAAIARLAPHSRPGPCRLSPTTLHLHRHPRQPGGQPLPRPDANSTREQVGQAGPKVARAETKVDGVSHPAAPFGEPPRAVHCRRGFGRPSTVLSQLRIIIHTYTAKAFLTQHSVTRDTVSWTENVHHSLRRRCALPSTGRLGRRSCASPLRRTLTRHSVHERLRSGPAPLAQHAPALFGARSSSSHAQNCEFKTIDPTGVMLSMAPRRRDP